VASIAITAGFAPLLGLSADVVDLVAVFAMIGDLFSSFLKRRLGFPPSTFRANDSSR
jgi:CDP-2,3-bis-(O-geranylgeranyl)-sn-glycerol synthase